MKEGTRHLLEKAERAIQAADILLAAGGAEFAAGRAYYAMFYTAEALLHERDQKFSKHGAVHAAFGKEFTKSGLLDPRFHRWLINAFDVRLQEDYDAETLVTAENFWARKVSSGLPPDVGRCGHPAVAHRNAASFTATRPGSLQHCHELR